MSKIKNEERLNEAIASNEKEIRRINDYMESFFTSDGETQKMKSHIHALESENETLRHVERSKMSHEEIIALTRPGLPNLEAHRKRKQGAIVRIPFTDRTTAHQPKQRHAIWKMVLSEWQYLRYE